MQILLDVFYLDLFYDREKLTKSLRKFIRQEKARIRREVLSSKKQEQMIDQLYQKFTPKKQLINDNEKIFFKTS